MSKPSVTGLAAICLLVILLMESSLAMDPTRYPPPPSPRYTIPGSYKPSEYSHILSALQVVPLSTPINFRLQPGQIQEIAFDFPQWTLDDHHDLKIHVQTTADISATVWMDLLAPFFDPDGLYHPQYIRMYTMGFSATEPYIDPFHRERKFQLATKKPGQVLNVLQGRPHLVDFEQVYGYLIEKWQSEGRNRKISSRVLRFQSAHAASVTVTGYVYPAPVHRL